MTALIYPKNKSDFWKSYRILGMTKSIASFSPQQHFSHANAAMRL